MMRSLQLYLHGSQIGDVYRYKNGTLHYYQWDDHDEDTGNELHDNIKPTIYRGVSGQTTVKLHL